MEWIDIAWPMISAASATLALIHLLFWLRQKDRLAYLGFAVAALSLAVIAIFEVQMMQAQTPREYATLLRWAHIPITTLVLGIIAFLMLQFGAGSRLLAAAAALTRIACTAANFMTGENLHYQDLPSLHRFQAWGDVISIPGTDAVPNPWMTLGTVSIVLLLLFMASVISEMRRRPASPDRRRALLICCAMTFFVVFAHGWNWAVIHHYLSAPLFLSPAFLFVLLGMGYEVGVAMLRSNQLAQDLAEARLDLLHAQRQGALAVKAADLGLWTWDIPTGSVWFSEHGLEILGYRPGEAVDVSALEMRIDAGDRARFQADVLEASARDGDYRGEYRAVYPDGRRGWLVIRGQVDFADDGTPLQLEGIFGDITERKSAEDRFHAMVRSAPAAILMFDEAGTVVLSNSKAEALFDYAPGELAGISVDRLLPGRFGIGHEQPQPMPGAETLMTDVGDPLQLAGYRKDGSELMVQVSLNPIPVGSKLLVFAMMTDLTETTRLQRESALQREELAHLSRVALLSELSGSLAHELNQPLTAILANAQAAARFLDRDPPDIDEVRSGLRSIVESDKRAGDVIRKIRALLRKDSTDFRFLSVNEVITDVLTIIRSDLLNRNIETVVELADGVPAVCGDAVQLQQVLLNLIINASDAMRDSKERLVTLRTEMASPSQVVVSVSDTGCGIPDESIDAVFAPFFTTKPEGLGLGLAVCSTIINAHHGALWAANNAVAGATVSFSLPVGAELEPLDERNGTISMAA